MAEPLSLSELRQIARRRVLYFIIPAVLVWVVGAVLAYSLPSVYQSTGVILVEAQEIPEDLVRSTVTGFAERRIQVINQRVMSSANLRRIVDRFDLYAAERSQMPISAVLDRFRSDVSLSTISAEVSDRAESATIAFEVTYESTDPGIAQRVANELTSLYLSENLRTRTAAAAETSEFLTEEARRLAERMQQLGARIAEFKQAHQGNLPEQADLNAQLLRSTEQSIGELRRRIETVQERQVFLNAELAQVEPHRPVYDERGQVLQSPEQKLRALEARQITPVGGTAMRSVNVRVVAATNRQLEDEVAEGRFREDLYYRLAVIKLVVPPLRERREDIPLLARRFADELELDELPGEVLAPLCERPWPGNVRELRNAVQVYAALGQDAPALCPLGELHAQDGVVGSKNRAHRLVERDLVRAALVRLGELARGVAVARLAKRVGAGPVRLFGLGAFVAGRQGLGVCRRDQRGRHPHHRRQPHHRPEHSAAYLLSMPCFWSSRPRYVRSSPAMRAAAV